MFLTSSAIKHENNNGAPVDGSSTLSFSVTEVDAVEAKPDSHSEDAADCQGPLKWHVMLVVGWLLMPLSVRREAVPYLPNSRKMFLSLVGSLLVPSIISSYPTVSPVLQVLFFKNVSSSASQQGLTSLAWKSTA